MTPGALLREDRPQRNVREARRLLQGRPRAAIVKCRVRYPRLMRALLSVLKHSALSVADIDHSIEQHKQGAHHVI
jgi:hypothetical protein